MTYLPDGSGAVKIWAIPASLAAESAAARETLVELVAEADDALMARFFDEGTLTNDELAAGLARAVADSKIFPVLCTSALTNVAMQPLLDALVRLVPSPADRPFQALAKDGTPTTIAASDSGPTSAFVWRTVADAFAGRITLFRVVTGRLLSDTTATNASRGDATERLGHLLVVQGKTHTSVPEVKAGDLGAVAKLKETQSGDTLCRQGWRPHLPAAGVPGSGTRLRHRAEDARRRRQDQLGAAPPAGGGSDGPFRPRPADQGSAALGPGSAAHRGDRRQAEAAVRRRRDAQAAARALPRNHRRAGRGARPPQEADRWPRPVRRLHDQGRAAAARRRLRVHRRHVRRIDPAPVRAGRREGHPGGAPARLSGRVSDGRLPRHRRRRLVPSGRLERAVVQDGRRSWRSRTRWPGPARRCSNR